MVTDKKVIPPNSKFQFTISDSEVEVRLDSFLASQFSSYSRSFFKKVIESKKVLVNGKPSKASYILRLDDKVEIVFPEAVKVVPKEIDVDLGVEVVFEHPDFLVVYKPAGLLVHATDTTSSCFTLVDWLLNKYADLKDVGVAERPGIVHRLDQDTSGLLLIARNNFAHGKLSQMFKDRQIHKTYLAVVKGHPPQEGSIDYPIMRHPVYRNKMTHVQVTNRLSTKQRNARDALTHYKVLEDFEKHALVEAKPVTGRTHQIRVHLAGIGHSLIGDKLYGQKSSLIARHALHAKKLEFEYEGKPFEIEKDEPKDLQLLISKLKKTA